MSERDAWDHSPEWDEGARAVFEAKLARSRNKVEHLIGKAGALIETGDPALARAGIHLLDRALDLPQIYAFREATILEMQGDAHVRLGDSSEAESCYRRCLLHYDAAPDPAQRGNGTSGVTDLSLAELLISRGDPADRREAASLLANPLLQRKLVWNAHRYRFAVAHARLAMLDGQRSEAAQWSRSALAIAADPTPQLARHPGVGVVDPSHSEVEELRQLAREA